MVNRKALLIVSGILVVAGILISYMQSEDEMNDIAIAQQTVSSGSSMNVSKSLDPSAMREGVYSVQITDFKQGETLGATVVDPSGIQVATSTVTKSPYQQNFTISSAGLYNLKIQNNAQSDLTVQGIIGYYPQPPNILDLVSIVILFAGLSGLAVGMMYFIKTRGKMGPS